MKFPGFLGPSVPARSPAINSQRTVNLYLEVDQQNGKAPLSMYGMPGLTALANLPTQPVRALYVAQGRNCAVAGNTLFELSADWTPTARGTIGTSTGPVQIVDNGIQLGIFDYQFGWVYDLGTAVFSQITAEGFPNGTGAAGYIDGFIVAVFPGSEKFGVSTIKDIRGWDALDFASAEGLPDNLVGCIVVQRIVYLLGTDSMESWSNTGGADFPLSRIEGSFVETGCAAPATIVKIDNGFCFLGNDKRGTVAVYKVSGPSSLAPISNAAIATEFSNYTLRDAQAFGFNFAGHTFYVITFPTDKRTWVYDFNSQAWTEWLYFKDGAFQRHRANCFAVMNGKLIVGDWENGKMYELDEDAYTDDGQAIRALRATTITSLDERYFTTSCLQVVMEQGVGTQTGQGADPKIMLRVSDDGGLTWKNERTAPIGKVGKYANRSLFWRLGIARNRMYEVSITDPVKRVFVGAQLT